jgi:hypothetical protein
MENNKLLEGIKALLEADKPKEIIPIIENSEEEKKKIDEKLEVWEEQRRERLRTAVDENGFYPYEEAKKFWASPKGKATIKRAKDRGFR